MYDPNDDYDLMPLSGLTRTDLIERRAMLLKRGLLLTASGFCISLLFAGILFLLANRIQGAADAVTNLALALYAIGCIVAGIGLADLAERKGHSRNNGWWVLLGLIGLIVVDFLADNYKDYLSSQEDDVLKTKTTPTRENEDEPYNL